MHTSVTTGTCLSEQQLWDAGCAGAWSLSAALPGAFTTSRCPGSHAVFFH